MPDTERTLELKRAGALLGAEKSAASRSAASRVRKDEVLAAIRAGLTVEKACAAVGVQPRTYSAWRERDKTFAAQADAARLDSRAERGSAHWDGGFGDFRQRYLDHPSPPFHLEIVHKLETMDEGEIGLVLMPPEHGKTTLLEDFAAYKLALDPAFRIVIGSYREKHGAKVINQLQTYMDPNQPGCRQAMIARFGPFLDPDVKQIWAATQMQVAKRPGDQRDPSVQTIGITANGQGIRTDLFVIDDVQGTRSLGETESIANTIRQDWFTRTGAFGRVVMIGTRVGPGDVYETLMDANLFDWVIKYPAYRDWEDSWPAPDMTVHQPKKHRKNLDPAGEVRTFLWPERYSPKHYLTMRINAGEEAWARNYMQKSRGAKGGPFNENMLAAASQPWHSIVQDPPPDTVAVVLGLDPGYSKNALMACAMHERWLLPVAWRVDEGLENTQAIMGVVEEYLHQFTLPARNVRVTDVLIEDKAFQKGLLADEGLKALRERFGFRVSGHQTGVNKYDPDIGVPQLARAFERDEIRLPGADDGATEKARELLDDQLLAWRPGKRGTKLTQDLTMALWFCWLVWRQRRAHLAHDRVPTTWQVQALPWAPTRAGLLVPTGR